MYKIYVDVGPDEYSDWEEYDGVVYASGLQAGARAREVVREYPDKVVMVKEVFA